MRTLAVLLLAPAISLLAQDERRVASPDGQIEFRIALAQPEPGALFQLAYQVFYHGKPLLDTSFLGLDIHNQEPILGANLGLTASKADSVTLYNSLTAEYMQNGSLGRRLNVEVRAYNEGIAFRYRVPRSVPLDEILLDHEATEFSFARNLDAQGTLALPFVTEQRGLAWVKISEVPLPNYPRMSLKRTGERTLISSLAAKSDSQTVLETTAPLVSPWRILLIGSSPERLNDSKIVGSLPGL
jgi:alpha-glucosidase